MTTWQPQCGMSYHNQPLPDASGVPWHSASGMNKSAEFD
jgi:hypothetical protein